MAAHPSAHVIVLASQPAREGVPHLPVTLKREPLPEQFCTFSGRRTLLHETVKRFAPLVAPFHLHVVTTDEHVARARQQLMSIPARVVGEPCHRGGMVTVLRALHEIAARYPRAPVIITPSHHTFRHAGPLHVLLARAIGAVEEQPEIAVTLASEADAPAVDQAWMLLHNSSRQECAALQQVGYFVSAPRASLATRLFKVGAVWCAHVLAGIAAVLLRQVEEAAPDEMAALRAALDADDPARLEVCYRALPHIDFERLFERMTDLHALQLPRRAGWSDAYRRRGSGDLVMA